MNTVPKRSLKDVFDDAEREIDSWPDWKKALLKRARENDAYWALQTKEAARIEQLFEQRYFAPPGSATVARDQLLALLVPKEKG